MVYLLHDALSHQRGENWLDAWPERTQIDRNGGGAERADLRVGEQRFDLPALNCAVCLVAAVFSHCTPFDRRALTAALSSRSPSPWSLEGVTHVRGRTGRGIHLARHH